eukprot:355350-Chlamydomonas_euryale.AAC.3
MRNAASPQKHACTSSIVCSPKAAGAGSAAGTPTSSGGGASGGGDGEAAAAAALAAAVTEATMGCEPPELLAVLDPPMLDTAATAPASAASAASAGGFRPDPADDGGVHGGMHSNGRGGEHGNARSKDSFACAHPPRAPGRAPSCSRPGGLGVFGGVRACAGVRPSATAMDDEDDLAAASASALPAEELVDGADVGVPDAMELDAPIDEVLPDAAAAAAAVAGSARGARSRSGALPPMQSAFGGASAAAAAAAAAVQAPLPLLQQQQEQQQQQYHQQMQQQQQRGRRPSRLGASPIVPLGGSSVVGGAFGDLFGLPVPQALAGSPANGGSMHRNAASATTATPAMGMEGAAAGARGGGGSWAVSEVEDYSADYELCWSAFAAAPPATAVAAAAAAAAAAS